MLKQQKNSASEQAQEDFFDKAETDYDIADTGEHPAALNFSDDLPTPSFVDLTPELEAESTINSAETTDRAVDAGVLGGELTQDDLALEILIKEDGALSPQEAGSSQPADQSLTVVDIESVGAGFGLDEAELAEQDPLDEKVNAIKPGKRD